MVSIPSIAASTAPHHRDSLVAEPDADASTQIVVTAEMLNGHGILHGGHVFALARQQFMGCAAAPGSQPRLSQADVTYITPASSGERLTITTQVRARYGRHMICEIEFRDAQDQLTALVRCSGSVTRTTQSTPGNRK